jgi:hypothetical protein
MATVAYATTQDVKDQLGGNWGPPQPTGSGSNRDDILASLAVRASRLFDRETGRPTGYWAAATAISRLYSGSGNQWLDVDDWQLITSVTMAVKQDRSDVKTLLLTYNPADPGDYVVVWPTNGPPFNRLYLLRGWLPDPFQIGNITVTGNVVTPEEINYACAVWAAYLFRRAAAGLSDTAQHLGNPPGQTYKGTIPPEVQTVISYYVDRRLGPKLAVEDGTDRERRSPWLSWVTAGN